MLNKSKKSADHLSFLKKSVLSSKRFLNLAAVRLEHITLAPDIFQVDRLCRVGFYLAAEVVDMYLYRPHIAEAFLAPYLLVELVGREEGCLLYTSDAADEL